MAAETLSSWYWVSTRRSQKAGTGGAAGARQAGPRPGARLVHGPALTGARHEQEPAEPREAHGAAGQRAGRPRVARVPAQPVRQRAAGGAGGAGRQRALAGAGLRAAPDPRCASAPLTRVLRTWPRDAALADRSL